MPILLLFLVLISTTFLHGSLTASHAILIVGGAGYIGSHVNEMLYRQGYQTIVLDNLSHGNREAVAHGTFIQGDLEDTRLLDEIFSTYKIDAVMHFAALKDVGESVKEPLRYYENNVANTLNLLSMMVKHRVNRMIFSSSAAIFGNPQEIPVSEEHPCHPINPYGKTKLMVEKILEDFDHAYGIRYSSLRYFNAAGGDPQGQIKNYQLTDSNLIPIILRNILKGNPSVTIFGTNYATPDGTCIRDYIHIEDLGTAHIAALENLLKGSSSSCYNLGNGNGFSVREVIAAAEKVTGIKIHVYEGARRPGDPAVLIASSDKAKQELHWNPQYSSLETIIQHAWEALQRDSLSLGTNSSMVGSSTLLVTGM